METKRSHIFFDQKRSKGGSNGSKPVSVDFGSWYEGKYLKGLEPPGEKQILKDPSEIEKLKQRAEEAYKSYVENSSLKLHNR